MMGSLLGNVTPLLTHRLQSLEDYGIVLEIESNVMLSQGYKLAKIRDTFCAL